MSGFLKQVLEMPAVERFGWTLLHFLWEGAAAAFLLTLALAVFRKSRTRYALCLGALTLLAALPAVTFLALPGPVFTDTAASVSPAAMVGLVPAAHPGTLSAQVDASPRTIGSASMPERQMEGPRTASPIEPAGGSLARMMMHSLTAAAPWLVPAWAAGVLLLSLWNFAAWAGVQRLKQCTTAPVGEALVQTARTLAAKLRVKSGVRVLQSALADSPLVIGFFKPVILLPASMLTGLSTGQLEALLAHELAHIRRHDYVVNLAQTVVETLLFYHPAVWWISARIRAERENCCDDLAVAATQDRRTYVQALAAVANIRPALLAPAAATGGRGVLLSRLQRILERPARDAARPARWVAGVVAMALCALVVMPVVLQQASSVQAAMTVAKHPPAAHARFPATKPGDFHDTKCELAGRVVDSDGNAVAGAKVYFCNDALKPHYVADKDVTWAQDRSTLATVTTDAQGHFRFNYMHAGQTDVWAETPKAAGMTRDRDSNEKDVTIQLAPKGPTIAFAGRLIDTDGTTPVANMTMQLLNSETSPKLLAETKTDAGGHYKFEIKPVYSYSPCLHLLARPERRAMAWATLPICSLSDFDLQLRPAVKLTGRVQTENGQMLAAARVQVLRLTDLQYGLCEFDATDRVIAPAATTDKDGKFTLASIPQGATVMLYTSHPEYAPTQTDVEAAGDERQIPDIRLPNAAVIEGTVYLGSKDKPVEGAKVTLGYPMMPEQTVMTDKNGHYRVGGVYDFTGETGGSQQQIRAEFGGTPPQWEALTYHEAPRKGGDHFAIDLVLEPSLAARAAAWKALPGKPLPSKYEVAILDDADQVYKNKTQYDDTLKLTDGEGRVLWQQPHLNSFGPLLAEVGPQHDQIWVGETDSRLVCFSRDGRQVWEKPNTYAQAMAVDGKTGNIWALTSKGIIYGDRTLVLSPQGEQVQDLEVTGHEIAYSAHDDCFWIVSKGVQKVDRDGKVQFKSPEYFPWVATAVGVNEKDGSVWVAEGRHPNVMESRGRVWVFESDGTLRKNFSVDHDCRSLVVDSTRGVVWIGGDQRLCKVDLDGKVLAEAPIAYGSSCSLEPDTGYLWCSSFRGGVYRLDTDARPVWSDVSTDSEKWVAVVAR